MTGFVASWPINGFCRKPIGWLRQLYCFVVNIPSKSKTLLEIVSFCGIFFIKERVCSNKMTTACCLNRACTYGYRNKGTEVRMRLVPSNMFKPLSKFLTDRSKAVLLLWIMFVICVACLSVILSRLFLATMWSPVGKGLTSWPSVM